MPKDSHYLRLFLTDVIRAKHGKAMCIFGQNAGHSEKCQIQTNALKIGHSEGVLAHSIKPHPVKPQLLQTVAVYKTHK